RLLRALRALLPRHSSPSSAIQVHRRPAHAGVQIRHLIACPRSRLPESHKSILHRILSIAAARSPLPRKQHQRGPMPLPKLPPPLSITRQSTPHSIDAATESFCLPVAWASRPCF